MPQAEIKPPENLELHVEFDHDATVLHCKGNITLGETRLAFRSAVVNLLHQHHKITVDLRGIHCMDRSGLEALVSLYSSARTAGATLKFTNLTIPVSDAPRGETPFHKLAS